MSIARLSEYSNLEGVDTSIGSRTMLIVTRNDYVYFTYYDLDPGFYSEDNLF
jgi:hypothetical protein